MSSAEIRSPDARRTPVKRRRLLPLVDLRGPPVSPGDFNASSGHLSRTSSLSGPSSISMEISGSASLGPGRRPRPALTDLSRSGFCASVDSGDGFLATKKSSPPIKISQLQGVKPHDDSVSRFPRLDQCAHFHYEFVELPPIQVSLVSEELKPLSQASSVEDAENKSLLVQVAALGRSWVIRRTFDNFRFLDKQLHRCCYDRKISQLPELPIEENVAGSSRDDAVEELLSSYLSRLSSIAGSLITCGPVLSWLELDNRGHRLIVTDDSDINTPAVAAAYVIKRYTAQASDEISVEVGDMISVIDMPPPEESIWWRGKRGFQVGFFPCECVQVIEGKVPPGIHASSLTLPPTKGMSSPGNPSSSLMAQEPMKPVLRKHGKLIAFFRPEMVEETLRSFILSRPPRPFLKRSGILRERVFGCDLAEHLLNSGHEIPMVLKCCSEFVETHGTVDGIYRLSGITSNIQKLRNAFDEERIPALYEDDSILQDIHCVSSVLKMYFRELPNPLLTYQLYDKFVQAVIQEEDKRLLHVRDVVQQLPPPHYRTLEYLIRHLSRIASHSQSTNMTPTNIAIVWAPNLLRSKDLERGGVAALQDVGTQAVVTEYLIRYVDLIFNDKIPSVPSCVDVPKMPRPKSLAISTPVTLLSVNEARKRSLASIKSDQNYIDVGGGPGTLPKTYHTVINLPSRKGGSLKHKKSPLGWKNFFWKNRHQKKSSGHDGPLNVSDPAVLDTDCFYNHKRLRPVKSVESLASTPVSLHSSRNSQVLKQNATSSDIKNSPSYTSSPISSPRAHNRSASHDSYFGLLDRSIDSQTKNDQESDFSSSPKMCLEMKELNMNFDISENDVRVLSEDETLQSTSIDTNSRSTLDMEVISMSSCRSKEVRRKSLKDQLRHHRKKRSSSEDSRFLHKASNNYPFQLDRIVPLATCDVKEQSDSSQQSKDVSECISYNDDTPSRESLESALIEPELLERITHLRVSPISNSPSNSPPEKKEANQSNPPSYLLGFPPVSLASPETPQGDSTFLEIQYDPLSDTTDPSSNSDPVHKSIDQDLKLSSPLSPVSSPEDTIPEYENIDIKLSDSGLSNDPSSEAQTPIAPAYEPLLQGDQESKISSYENLSCEPEYVNMESAITQPGDSEDAMYENVSFQDDVNYKNCNYQSESLINIPVDVDGEIVYQKVKYLKQSIKEVNDIVNDDGKSHRKSVTKLTIHMTPKVSDGSSIELEEVDQSLCKSQESECLESPVTPTSSIVTEIMPSFSSPTHESLEDTMSEKGVLDECFQEPSPSCVPHCFPVLSPSPELQSKSHRIPVPLPRTLPIPSSSPKSPTHPIDIHMEFPSVSNDEKLETLASEAESSDDFDIGSKENSNLSHIEDIPICSGETPINDSQISSVVDVSLLELEETTVSNEAIVNEGKTTAVCTAESSEDFQIPTCSKETAAKDFHVSSLTALEANHSKSEDDLYCNQTSVTESHVSGVTALEVAHTKMEDDVSCKESPLIESQIMSVVTAVVPMEEVDIPSNLQHKTSLTEYDVLTESSEGDCNSLASDIMETDAQRRERIEKYKEERRNFLRKNYNPNSFKGEKDDMILRLKQKTTSPSRNNEEIALKTKTDDSIDKFSSVDSAICSSEIPKDRKCSKEISIKETSTNGMGKKEEINVKERVAKWSRHGGDIGLKDELPHKSEEKKINRKITPNLKPSQSSSKISQLSSTFSNRNEKRDIQSESKLRNKKPPVLPSPKTTFATTRSVSETNVCRPVLQTQKSESHIPAKVPLKPVKRYSSGSSIESNKAAKLLTEAIGQDKIKAITAQFERESIGRTPKPIFLRQVSK